MQGRSTVMKESFRSTRPITEFALNVLYRLEPPGSNRDHKELVDLGLIEKVTRRGDTWWNVRFNQVEGPTPVFRKYNSLEQQVEALGEQVVRWITYEGVKPCDICILSHDRSFLKRVNEEVGPRLLESNARIVFDPGQGDAREANALVVSTSASFKGYEAEIVIIGGVERFIGKKQILPASLYVAMTRARSELHVYAYDKKNKDPQAQTILSTLQLCLDGLLDRPTVEQELSNLDDFEDVLGRLGTEHRDWLATLWKGYLIQQEPIAASDGEILAEPMFWFQVDDRVVACFGKEEPGPHTMHKLEDNKVQVIRPGQKFPL
jgi:superfamily I DNA/RNA helicase